MSALDRAIDTREITAGKLTAEETHAMQVLVRIREDAKDAINAITAKHNKALAAATAEHRKTRTLAALKIREIEARAAIRVIEAGGLEAPGVRRFNIWSEGYSATGNEAPAQFMGSADGETFADACAAFFRDRADAKYFNPEGPSYWGCRLFDNEADARKSFG